MISDRQFNQSMLYAFLSHNADQFSSNLHEQIARSGNGTLEQYTEKLSTKGTIAYEMDGETIKGIIVGYTHDLPADGKSYITYVIVDRKYRGQGVMRRLLEEYQEYCRQLSIPAIWLTTGKTNYSAQKAYERCGFVSLGEHTERTIRYEKDTRL